MALDNPVAFDPRALCPEVAARADAARAAGDTAYADYLDELFEFAAEFVRYRSGRRAL